MTKDLPMDARESMRAIGQLADPVHEALRRMIAEFGDQHYHACPADNDSGPCECFAGHVVTDATRVLMTAMQGDVRGDPGRPVPHHVWANDDPDKSSSQPWLTPLT